LNNNLLFYSAVLTSIILLLLFARYLKHRYNKKHQLASILEAYSQDEVKNIIVPDGVGGLIEIEHLVLLKQGILLLETNPISGVIFAADKMENWSQVFDGRSYKFINPLYRLQLTQQAISELVPDINVFCRLVFMADDASFPKGKPEKVSTRLLYCH